MAWYANHYSCDRCGEEWVDEWSCMCNDECPECGSRDYEPFDSEDLTELIERDGDDFVVLRSPDTAEHDPDYEEIGRFPTREAAQAFLDEYDPDDPDRLQQNFAARVRRMMQHLRQLMNDRFGSHTSLQK